MKHTRSRAREAAVKALYRIDVLGEEPDKIDIKAILKEERLKRQAFNYAMRLLEGYLPRRKAIDEAISEKLENWSLSRLAVLDRCILRLAAHELLSEKGVPGSVIINEAVELAKKYSTAQSGSFVNGVLDRIDRQRKGEL